MPLLFVYGTLRPEDPETARYEGWREDAVRGRLYDLGPYPALVDLDRPDAGLVEGFVHTVTHEQLTGILDDYEGVETGLFQRTRTITQAGREVWLYVYGQAIPSTAVGPLTRWNSPKRVRLLAFSKADNPEGES